jgi:3-oxoacyl-[acyl-carrier protein] reductase
MSNDLYTQLVSLPVAGTVAKRIGLPQPVELERDASTVDGRVLLGGAGRLARAAARVLADMGVDAATALDDPVRDDAAAAGLDAAVFNPQAPADRRFKALVFDASGIESSADLVELQRFFYPTVSRLLPSGRVIVLGGGRRALEGFTRSLGKEVGPSRGATVNLIHVADGAEDQLGPTLRFFLTPRSAYVSGQVVHVGPGREVPLAGRVALVTGASRGIGAARASCGWT